MVNRIMNVLLLIGSILIYLSFGIKNFIFILFSILTAYIAARLFKKKYKKTILITTIVLNAAILIFIRFLPITKNIFTQINTLNILIPLGISYYSLQVISYLIDVYKGKYKAEKNIFNYFLCITYLPHLFIGPISKYNEIKQEFLDKNGLSWNNLGNGFVRILWGLLKKLVIAGRIAIVIASISGNPEIYNGWYVLLAIFLYSIQLYSDFSGGIDIVLGISTIFGINLIENFDSPYYSESIKEFWRRWHISLGRWLKDYIYIPLGGNRCGKKRQAINLLITFLVSGIWHGVNFILWGVLHGIFVIFDDNYKTPFKWLNRVINFIIVSFLWSFFIWDSTVTAIAMIGSVFMNFNIVNVSTNILNLGIKLGDWIVLIIFGSVLFVFDGNKVKIISKIKNLSPELKTTFVCILILIIIIFGIYGIGFDVNEFIYSKF